MTSLLDNEKKTSVANPNTEAAEKQIAGVDEVGRKVLAALTKVKDIQKSLADEGQDTLDQQMSQMDVKDSEMTSIENGVNASML